MRRSFKNMDKMSETAAAGPIVCSYSDITLLHDALYSQSGLRTFYDPAALIQLAEFPKPHKFTLYHFLDVRTTPPAA
jgi:muramoyltetrapeptide carboxypeptidase LdcA involved in peptidoglycan recycling